MIAALLLAATSLAACASNPTPNDESAVQARCPGDYRLKCFKRIGEPSHCNCVPPGEVEETIDALRTFGIH